MKKIVTLLLMLTMVCSFSLTAHAGTSPSGKPVGGGGAGTESGTGSGTGTATSPKTGENDIVLYSLGATAVLLASGAVVIKKKAM